MAAGDLTSSASEDLENAHSEQSQESLPDQHPLPGSPSSTHPSTQARPTQASRRPSAFALARLNEPSRRNDRVQEPTTSQTPIGTPSVHEAPLSPQERAPPVTRSSVEAPSPLSSPTPRFSPASVSPTRSRNRGYSLRTSLFHKNVHGGHTQGAHGAVEEVELDEAGPSTSGGTPRQSWHTRQPSNKKNAETSVRPVAEDDEELSSRAPRRKSESTDISRKGNLPTYEAWLRDKAAGSKTTRRLASAYQKARKFVLRIVEIPPTADGRHIDIDAQRSVLLLDERTSKPYIGNTIRSSRYNIWDFVPRQLWAQFSKLANAYFLCVSILQLIPGLSTTGTYTTIVPLLVFITIAIAKEGYDDYWRYKLDLEENARKTKVLRASQPRMSGDDLLNTPLDSRVWVDMAWRDLRVGDLVKLERDDQVPADLILLSSKGEKNTAYIETMALDGETNLKSKQPPPSLARTCNTLEGLAASNAHLVVEDPNMDLYNFEGKVTTDGETMPLSNTEVVYRGSILRNTSEAIGMVIYTGEECKIRMNASKRPRIKAPSLQFVVNKIVIAMVVFVVALAIFNTAAYQIWAKQAGNKQWYILHQRVPTGPLITSFIIMFNTMIPLSLYVSLEIVKVFQRLQLADIDMYDEESDTPMEARTSTINEELGQISYIFSDKTGTLTDNCMKFRKLSVAGTAWLHDPDLKLDEAKLAERRRSTHRRSKGKEARTGSFPRSSTTSALPRISEPGNDSAIVEGDDIPASPTWQSSAQPGQVQHDMHTVEMIRYIQRRPYTVFARKARFFLLSMALCHTCLPEIKSDGTIDYQASSPDELALVEAARELGYMLVDTHSGVVTVRTYPNGMDHEAKEEKYEVLETIEFSSKRKRMSIIVRFPDQRICIFSKGADSTLMKLLRMSSVAFQKTSEIERRTSARKSMEAQQAIARRRSSVRESIHGARTSLGGLERTSLSYPTTSSRNQLDAWLTEQENDVHSPTTGLPDSYSPRPSGQYPRSSLNSSRRGSGHTDHGDFELVEESLAVDDSLILERCCQHVNDFATEGLRTLLYGYRFLTEDEYQTWRKVYRDASTSLVNRQHEIERAGELIEHSLELAGATAIEDKLQKGVPEAVDKLRRAGIKLWMLTGDKRETAINIGHSCRLIKDYSTVTILDIDKPRLEQLIATTIVAVTAPSAENTIAHSVVVVDGATLAAIDDSATLKALFTDLAPLVDSVICCRASPAQKASLVRTVRHKVRSSITLAIGDGANDIAMIQEAHVGIGITGKEGLQAARTSDYSIAQFRFLTKLLLVHGRWNYIRTAKYTAATFWKEMMFYLTQALYQRYTGYTATSLYESWSLTTFNTLFSSLPVIFLGILEKDLLPQTLLAVPELYASMGLRSAAFNWRVYAWWIFLAASEANLVFWLMYALYGSDGGIITRLSSASPALATFTANSPFLSTINASSGGSDGIYPLGALTFTACIVTISVKLQFLEMHSISFLNFVAAFLSIGGWFLWSILLSLSYSANEIYHVRGGFLSGYGRDLGWWAALAVILAAVGVLEVSWRALRWVVGQRSWTLLRAGGYAIRIGISGPSDAEVFQCLEKDPIVMRRFEDAARKELWWSLGEGRGDETSEEEKREEEVDELLRVRSRQLDGGVDGVENSGWGFGEGKSAGDEGLRRRTSLGV